MTYETAKKLKDAGFKQTGIHSPLTYSRKEGEPYYPYLNELIEACGDEFDALFKCRDNGVNIITDGWIAVDKDNTRAWGNTPEEAVAELWLALNKTK